jgi:hypothetical protein
MFIWAVTARRRNLGLLEANRGAEGVITPVPRGPPHAFFDINEYENRPVPMGTYTCTYVSTERSRKRHKSYVICFGYGHALMSTIMKMFTEVKLE